MTRKTDEALSEDQGSVQLNKDLFLRYNIYRSKKQTRGVACLQVLYLDVAKDGQHDQLLDLAAASRSHFEENGFMEGSDSRSFAPHVTIAKLSNLAKGRHGRGRGHIKAIPDVGPFRQHTPCQCCAMHHTSTLLHLTRLYVAVPVKGCGMQISHTQAVGMGIAVWTPGPASP
jgi:hypothetical protein